MQMYPAYRRRDVLAEYAISFYGFLEEGYRRKSEDHLMQINILAAALGNVVPEERIKFLKQLEWASKDASDILTPSGDANGSDGIDDLKKMFRKI